MPAYDLDAQGVQSTPQKPDDLEMTMHLLQSAVVQGVSINDRVLILV